MFGILYKEAASVSSLRTLEASIRHCSSHTKLLPFARRVWQAMSSSKSDSISVLREHTAMSCRANVVNAEKVLQNLSDSDPVAKLKVLRRDRQPGTGTWLFDLEEMSSWIAGTTSALWIYGLPGAGKTTLSTLVVDEVLFRKRNNAVGTAFFYVRHDDPKSQSLSNVLGSLITQLARQNALALADIMVLRAQLSGRNSLSGALDENELVDQIHIISRHFDQVFIMIDGLDECGSTFDSDRKRLVDAVAGLHHNDEDGIRVLVFSRDELDIRSRFNTLGFKMVSVAATSADLRLFVNAWLPSLDCPSAELRAEAAQTLVRESDGM